jgi:alkylation response protein AidB-like acyl-CoA dehydrogenase
LRLFHPEHKRALRAFYGDAAEGYIPLLEGLSAILEKEVLPKSKGFDLNAGGIAEARRVLFDQGLCGMTFASDGGMSLPFGVYSLAMELVGAADAPTAMSMGIHNTVAETLYRFGSEPLRSTYLPDLLTGKRLGAFALTEASSGSDARSMKTRAVRSGSHFTLNGSKMFITNGGEADTYLVFAATDGGHVALIVDGSTPGLATGPDLEKLGMRGSRTAEVRFEDCTVPAENLVGEDGRGFEYAKSLLNGSRIIMGSVCVGIARVALQKAVEYSSERRLFGKRLADLQITREKVADMRTEITASRLLCLFASRMKEAGDHEFASEAAQAKVMATEAAARVCDAAIQIFAGYGYTEADVHRHWRDARLLTIGEGTSEVLRMLIAGKELAEMR